MNYKIKITILIIGVSLLWNCKKNDYQKSRNGNSGKNKVDFSSDLPDDLKELENISIKSIKKQTFEDANLELESVFKSNDDVLFDGSIQDLAIDHKNRVYIVVQKPGKAGIYVFEPDGGFITSFVNSGRGPGEVQTIKSIIVKDNSIYVFDSILQKIIIFSLTDFSIKNEFKIKKPTINEGNDDTPLKAYDLVSVTADSNVVMVYRSVMASNQNTNQSYYYVDNNGRVDPNNILTLKRYKIYEASGEIAEGIRMIPFTMPFNRNSLIEFSSNGKIYTAWTDNFFIKIFDIRGIYQKSIFYPYEKSRLLLTDLEIRDDRLEIIKNTNVPNTWPALYDIEVDNKEQIWVFTITDSDSTYDGWLLNKSGDLLKAFSVPGEKKSNYIRSEPILTVKNGYLYIHKKKYEEGIDKVEKYRIDL